MSKHSLRLGGGKWAAKEDKLLAYAEGDISGKFLPHELDFSRGTDIGATRINKEGLIEKTRENMFTYSNDFRRHQVSDAPWGHNGLDTYYGPESNPSQMPDGEQGYDGSGGASFIKSGTNDGRHSVTLSQTFDGTQTISIYAKARGYNFLRIGSSSENNKAWFNLSDGSVGTKGSQVIDAKMIDVGNGWYRCSMTTHANLTSVSFDICRQDNEYEFLGDGTNGLFIQDAQRERGLVVTKYIDSVASTGKSGPSEDMPRIDYMNGKPQLLIEQKRKNLVPRSEALNFSGSAQRIAFDFGYMSPEGVKNAYKVTATPDSGDPISHFFISNQFTITASRKYAVSAFVKPLGDLTHVRFGFSDQDGSHAFYSYFDLTGDGGVINHTANGTGVNLDYVNIQKIGNDGWFRVAAAGDLGPDITAAKIACFLAPNATTTSFTGDNETSALWYGLQCEVHLEDGGDESDNGPFESSYIPTYGAAVTREYDKIADITSTSSDGITGNYNSAMFFDGESYKAVGNGRFLAIANTSGGASDPRILLFSASPSNADPANNTFRVYAQYLPDNDLDLDVLIDTPASRKTSVGEEFKAMIKVEGTKFSLFVNGIKEGEDSFTKQNDIEAVYFTRDVNDLGYRMNESQIFAYPPTDLDCQILTTKTTFNSFADMSETLNYNS